jgi:BirA family biotin operon repressor/biotin-[acetyl-CoA-carboxylase] ligase
MSSSCERVLRLLADGAMHSGAELAARLGVTRATVWNLVGELREKGVEIASIDRRGYRLPAPIELLDAAAMRRSTAGAELPEDIEVVFEIDSTNVELFERAPRERPGVLFAELQTSGRGRRGRHWLAPFGSGLTFSVAWTYRETPADLQALTLALGVAVAGALHELGAADARLKWPNDLVTPRGKLGGLLTQLRHESGGPAYVVSGLGLNLRLPGSLGADANITPALPPTDLHASIGELPARNAIAALLAASMTAAFAEFGRSGFSAFIERWRAIDALYDRPVRVQQGGQWSDGIARGVDRDGALLVERSDGCLRVHSGDVSVRSGDAAA